MTNSCYGPHPVRASMAYVDKVDKDPNHQFELFSIYEENVFLPAEDKFMKTTSYLAYPYDYALNYINKYKAKNSL